MAKIAKKSKTDFGVLFQFADASNTVMNCPLEDLNEAMIRQLAIHGLSQKIGDSYASADTVSEAIVSAKSVWENLKKGDFNARAQGTGGVVVEALARLKGIAVEDAMEAWNAADEEQQAAIRKNPRVKAMVDVIKGERASKLVEGTGDDISLDFGAGKKKGK